MPRALAFKPLLKLTPDSDPRFKRVKAQLHQGASRTKAHPPAAKKAAEAAKAAQGPANERVAGGKARQVDKIKEAKEGKPDQSSFLALLRAEIAKAMPKNLGETENNDSAAAGMKSGLKGNVAQQKEKSTQDVSGASKQAPSPAGEAKTGGPVAAEPVPPPPKVDGAEGMPAPKSDAEVSLKESVDKTKADLEEAKVTPKMLATGKSDPRYVNVDNAKGQVAQDAAAGPAKIRAGENKVLSSAKAQANNTAKTGAAAMIGVKKGGNTKVLTRQQQQKAKDEAKRKEVVDKIEAIYTATKTRVEAKLAALDTEVNGIFDRGVDAAIASLTRFLNDRIRDFKIRRYLSIPLLGLAAWVRDQFKGLPDEVNVIYAAGQDLFRAQMDALVVRVANLVEQRLKEAKAEVARGQQQIKDFVASQPRELQAVARQAQSDVNNRFQELEQGIENKKNELAQGLAQKYKEAQERANKVVEDVRNANKGLVQAFAEKLGELIKAIMEFKAKLMAILRKGEETIKLIIDDPLGFLGNLIAAVKGGIGAFAANIWSHLKRGFLKWLFGNMPPGVPIPADLSLVSIFKMVMGVLGITYDRMRAKAVKLIGERNVALIEKLVEYIRALITGGPAALWEKVKEDLSNLKAMVIDAIQDWIVTTIVKNAIAKIVSMFNPAGAIVQAIIAIYNIVMFVVERAAQIMEFVESVINSIHAIATGAIGGAIKKVETALGNAVPILIGFLARLIGLGGISQKIRDFITKVQSKVDAAIDKAIKKIVDLVKKLFGKGKGRGGRDARSPAEATEALRLATRKARALAAAPTATYESVRAQLPAIQREHGLTRLEIKPKGAQLDIRAEINPFLAEPLDPPNVAALKATLVSLGFFGSAPADIDKIARGLESDGNGKAVFRHIQSRKFDGNVGYHKLLSQLKNPSQIHSVYMALEQASRVPASMRSRIEFERTTAAGGDADLVIVDRSGAIVLAYQFKGVTGLGNIKSEATYGAKVQLAPIPAKRKIISMEVRRGTSVDFDASTNPALGHAGYMGGISAFKAAYPDITLKIRFSDGVVRTY